MLLGGNVTFGRMESRISSLLDESARLHAMLGPIAPAVARAASIMIEALGRGGKVMIAGNGGSAADAQHMAAELVNRFRKDRKPLAGIALTTDSSVLTSIGNDSTFDDIFARQVEALGRPGDVLVVMTTSGTSTNIVRAMAQASRMGIATIALTGQAGVTGARAACEIRIPSAETPRIQEVHLLVEHILCELVEDVLCGSI